MSTKNPHFKNRERAPFELSDLLRNLPPQINLSTDPNATETRLQLEAAMQHADNYSCVLLDGLVSMGRVLFSAGENESFPVEPHDAARLGSLIAEIGIQLQFLEHFRTSANDRLAEVAQGGSRK